MAPPDLWIVRAYATPRDRFSAPRGRCDRPEDAVDADLGRAVPAVWPRCIEERRARAALAAGAERESPDAGRRHRKPSAVHPATVSVGVNVDTPAAEVRHQQVAA